jgi:imidazolonepropionase-like amidohydrolase
MLIGSILSLAIAGDLRVSAMQDPSREEQRVAIRAARVILRPGAELEDATILLERGVIVSIGRDLPIPEGAKVVEGAVACAGFVDPWSSLGLDPQSSVDPGSNPATRTIDSFDPWFAREERADALKSGVTAARVQVGRAAPIAGIGALVQTSTGSSPFVVLDDACMASSIGLSRGGRPGDVFDRLGEVDRLVAALAKGRRHLEAQLKYRKDLESWSKAITEGEVQLEKDAKKAKKDREKEEKEAKEKGKEFKEKKYKEDKKPRRVRPDAEDEAMGRAVDGEIPLVVEVHRAAEIRALLDKTETFDRLRLVIAGGTEALGFAEELVDRSIPVILWPAPMGAGRASEYQSHDLSLAGELAREGVRVLIGSGGGPESRELRFLAALAVGHGMDRDAALAAITSNPAQVFDAADRIGVLEVGRSADVLVFDGDPLDTTTLLRHVVSRGQVVEP